MSIKLLQKETTYEIIYNEKEYSVTVLEDGVSLGYTCYDVFDEFGNILKGETELELISYLEANIE